MSNTIVALSTAPGPAALAIIRLSGDGAIEILSRCIRDKEKVASLEYKKISLQTFCDPGSKEIIDEITLIKYCAPHSYTGENMAELFCHGGQVVVERIIGTLLDCGAQYAHKGEFTKRAFLNGKMDLIKAESINELISSRSEAGYKAAISGYLSGYKSTIEKWKSDIEHLLVMLESDIEFPEEEDVARYGNEKKVESILSHLRHGVAAELEKRNRVKQAEKGIIVPIVGPKNAGKSTLFNSILGSQRAIVHHHAGTTRDFITESLCIDGIMVTLIDTAGIGVPAEEIEHIGIERSWDLIAGANIVIWVTPGDKKIDEHEKKIFEKVDGISTLAIISKADLGNNEEKVEQFAQHQIPVLTTSLIDETGSKSAADFIKQGVSEKGEHIHDYGILQNKRHELIAKKVLEEIDQIGEAGFNSEETTVFHVRRILDNIKEFVGEITPGDILNRIFSEFCIGK